MNRYSELQKMICLIFLLTVGFSCTNKEPSNTKVDVKLKYTSGIRSILQDSKGNYWLGSHQEGLCLFDGKTLHYFTVENGLSDNQVRRIQEDEEGTIWFGTANGVSSYKNGRFTNQTQKSFVGLDVDAFTENNWKVSANDLWFNAGNKGGVYRFDGNKLHHLTFPVQGNRNSSNRYGVTGFSKGKSGYLWIATYTTVFGFDGKALEIIDDESLGYSQETGILHVRSIFEDSKGNVWIGNNGIGVLLIDGDTTINFSEKKGLVHHNSSRNGASSSAGTLEHVFAIAEDSQGNIWFGDRDTGAWKYDGKSMTNYMVDDALQTQHIWEIYENRAGELLFAMNGGGVYKFNGNSFERMF
ncbi:MAG: two-component regulator propeller domain-containing protein [Chitinophagales bacterium]